MENNQNDEVLLKVEHLCQYFKMGAGSELKAVDDVSFEVKKGEVFGLVGESGCGKTTTGRSIIKLYDITSGNVYFKGQRICAGTRSYEDAISAAKKEYSAEAKEVKRLIALDKKSGATEVRAEYAERLNAAKQKRDQIISEQKALIESARNDHKNCEKIYMKKLAAEYGEAVEKAGSPENLSDEDKEKFRPIENLPKIKKRTWIISALAVFAVALAFLIASISLFAVFNGRYGDFETVSAVVDASDATARTTTVHYEIGEKTYTKTLKYYDAKLGVSTPEQLVRLRIYYNASDPNEVVIEKPSEPRAVAFLIVFFVLCAIGAGLLIYVNERYNPTRLVTRIQMIFQDPIASLNPRMTVKDIISEGLIINGEKDKKYIEQKVYKVLELVGLVPEHAGRYPHEFSGGQRQRIGIARSVIMEPELIIADEPISALDVSIQAQVINLLNELRDRLGLTILFIAHDLSVVKYFSDRIGVMYFGKMVELASSDDLFAHPLHPYTKSLLSAIPLPDPEYEKTRKRYVYNPLAEHDYSVDKPSLREVASGHFVMCNDAESEKYRAELGQ